MNLVVLILCSNRKSLFDLFDDLYVENIDQIDRESFKYFHLMERDRICLKDGTVLYFRNINDVSKLKSFKYVDQIILYQVLLTKELKSFLDHLTYRSYIPENFKYQYIN